MMVQATTGATGTLARIAQRLIGLLGLFELFLGDLIARITVGMMLHRQPPVGLLDLGFAGVARHAEDFVIVAFGHSQTGVVGSEWRVASGAG